MARKRGTGTGLSTPTPSRAAGTADTQLSTKRSTYRTPLEAMRADEVLRTRVFLAVASALLVATLAFVPFLGGDPGLMRLVVATCAGCGLVFLGFYLYIREPENYSPDKALIPAFASVFAVTTAVHFFGVFSPALMVFPLGIYFFSLGSSPRATLIIYVTCALVTAASMLLVTFGVLPDAGLVRASGLSVRQKILLLPLVEMVYAVTYVVARLSRKVTFTAIENLEAALRQVGQREALLQEAQQDLERALKGGYRGRWSGERVGAWRLSKVIGRGAMGEVYEAQHEGNGQMAAVKLLSREVEAEPAQIRRFLREAELMSQIQSPHVVRVFDVGDGSAEPPYIAMELLRGRDLAQELRKRRRLPSARVVDLVAQVAEVLEQARRASIVHRDLKPQNLYWHEPDDGRAHLWKVLDFGVSKLGTSAGTLTKGHVIGTPGYMAPEQARGGNVDHRADVFSLAVITYRTLTGRPAFTGDDYPKVMFDLVYTQPARPGELVSLPEDVELVLALGLAKRVEDRFARAIDFAQALAQAAQGRLAEDLRERGRELLARHPWGK